MSDERADEPEHPNGFVLIFFIHGRKRGHFFLGSMMKSPNLKAFPTILSSMRHGTIYLNILPSFF
ncbi:hypothetical protein M413DRAFT_201473 [Hebeloma cylindrosporum]|uniref:Uncharacterized protein n=1 Tax=Hebeloma cylindrosporum TaxID=76867 RepID=A0A0C3CUC5_HEBCY|nr:hypothetical protein M413DRAFT_201473 [Hebeloma cylindrosporum h7]